MLLYVFVVCKGNKGGQIMMPLPYRTNNWNARRLLYLSKSCWDGSGGSIKRTACEYMYSDIAAGIVSLLKSPWASWKGRTLLSNCTLWISLTVELKKKKKVWAVCIRENAVS